MGENLQSLWRQIYQQIFPESETPPDSAKFEIQSGGCINRCYKVSSGAEIYFLKLNQAKEKSERFEIESRDLEELRGRSTLYVPACLGHGRIEDDLWLCLEWIVSVSASANSWWALGSGLAELHQNRESSFGLSYNNLIADLDQSNKQQDSWSDFYAEQRLHPLVRSSRDRALLEKSDVDSFERFYQQIGDLFPKEAPSLIHGDLWSGNFLFDQQAQGVLIDPAVYYGHREMDLAMSLLFGGFAPDFYESYEETFPLEKNWRKRVDFCNLYPLLVHLMLFGASYRSQIRQILRRF